LVGPRVAQAPLLAARRLTVGGVAFPFAARYGGQPACRGGRHDRICLAGLMAEEESTLLPDVSPAVVAGRRRHGGIRWA
jgi:hypothetical protein